MTLKSKIKKDKDLRYYRIGNVTISYKKWKDMDDEQKFFYKTHGVDNSESYENFMKKDIKERKKDYSRYLKSTKYI